MIRYPQCDTTCRRSRKSMGAAVVLCVLLASCSSDDDGTSPLNDDPTTDPDNDDRPGIAIEGLNGTPADQLTSPWLVNMSFFRLDSKTPGTGDGFVELVGYDDDFPVSSHIDFYTPELDTCEISDLSDTGDGGDDRYPDGISGGESLTLNTSSGSWFELPLIEGSIGVYETDNGLPGAFPADLSLSVPGDVFPAIANYPLREPEAPIRILPASDTLTMDDVTTAFTWVPGAQLPGESIDLTAMAFAADGGFIGFPVVCRVVDDGSFALPQEVVEAFGNTEDIIRVRFERVSRRVDFIDGVVFHQRTTVSE